MDFDIGQRVKVRLAGGGTWPGVVKGIKWVTIRKGTTPHPEYLVELDDVGEAGNDYYREYDLIIDSSRDFKWYVECTCGAAKTYAPGKPPGHAFHCDIERSNRPKGVLE